MEKSESLGTKKFIERKTGTPTLQVGVRNYIVFYCHATRDQNNLTHIDTISYSSGPITIILSGNSEIYKDSTSKDLKKLNKNYASLIGHTTD